MNDYQPDPAYDPESEPHMFKLSVTLDFTPGDLAANRRGDLTPRQITRLQWDQRRQYWPGLVAWALLLAILATLALMRLRAQPALMAVVAGGVVLAMVSAYEYRSQWHKLHEPDAVAHADFRVNDSWQPRRRFSVVEYEIGPRRFAMPHAVLAHLRDGQRYRVYYARELWSFPTGVSRTRFRVSSSRPTYLGSYRVLSMEPVSKHKQKRE